MIEKMQDAMSSKILNTNEVKALLEEERKEKLFDNSWNNVCLNVNLVAQKFKAKKDKEHAPDNLIQELFSDHPSALEESHPIVTKRKATAKIVSTLNSSIGTESDVHLS